MRQAIVTLKKGEGRLLKSGGAWIFDNEIDSIMGEFENGDIVIVHDFDGYGMGRGFINMNSKIRIRMMTRKQDQEIDHAFLEMRVRDAWEYRKKTVDTSSCRVIFGEADFLPGLVIDKFSDVLVVESLALGIDRMKEEIVDILKAVLSEDGITIRGVYERSDAKVRQNEGMERVKGFIGQYHQTSYRSHQRHLVENLIPKLRLWKMVSDIWLMSKTDRRQDFSWIRNTIVWQSRDFARMQRCWTASRTQALLR